MPEIMYSDIEVTAKVVMDPHTMQVALNSIQELLDKIPNKYDYGALVRLAGEMQQVLGRLSDMHVI